MTQMHLITTALLAGLSGGILGTLVIRSYEPARAEQLVRARNFELVNEAGQVISYWGIDKGQNAVLAFGNGGGATRERLDDPDNQLTAIGLLQGGTMPYLKMSGLDKKTRVRLYLTMYGRPVLLMEDETGPRLSLGIEQSDTPGPQDNDWSLVFNPEVARIGLHAEKLQGQIFVQGGVFVRKDKVKYPD